MESNDKELYQELKAINITLAKQSVILEEHTRRSTTLERYVEILEQKTENDFRVLDKKTESHATFIKIAMWALPILVTLSAILTQIAIKVF